MRKRSVSAFIAEDSRLSGKERGILYFRFAAASAWTTYNANYNTKFLASVLFAGMDYDKDISPVISALVMVTTVLGCVVSAVAGIIVSRTITRAGRYKPFGLYFTVPVVILNLMAFWSPAFLVSPASRIAFHVARTVVSTFLSGFYDQAANIKQVATPDSDEKRNLLATISIMATVGYGFSYLFVFLLGEVTDWSLKTVYIVVVFVIAALQLVSDLLCFTVVKERIEYNPEKVKITTATLEPFKHRPYLVMQFANWTRSFAMTGLMTSYLTAVFVGDTKDVLFTIPTVAGTVAGLALCSAMIKKLKIPPYLIMRFIGFYTLAAGIILAIVGPRQNIVFYGLYFLFGITFGFFNILPDLIAADVNDYMEWKTGQRIEAASGILADYVSKTIKAVSKVILQSVILVWAGFKAVTYEGQSLFDANAANRSETSGKLLASAVIITGAAYAANSLIYWFYDLYGDKKNRMAEELAVMRETFKEEQLKAENAAR